VLELVRETTKVSIRAFAVIVGFVLVFIGAVVIGSSRFTVHQDGGRGTCSSVFSGPNGDMGNASDLQQQESLDELSGQHPQRRLGDPSVDDLCNNERDQRRTWTWVLVGVGVALIAGGALIRPTRPTASGAA
jgi:uncharacterized membrane protein